MAASINDKFTKVIAGTTRPVATTLAAQKLSGATTASVVATTGWDTGTAVHGIMYRTDAGTGEKVAGSQIDWKATISGTTLSDFTVTAGSDDTYAVGTTVELAPTAAWGDDIATGILVHADQDGTLKAGAVDVAAVLADNVVTTAKILDSNVTTAKIADDAVTAAKMLNGLVKQRQGGTTGDASWDTQGTSNTDTSAKNVFIQVGSNVANGGSDKVVTFPEAFNQVPIVIATTSSADSRNVFTSVIATTTTTFTVRQLDDTGTTGSEDFNWIAIGQ